MLKFDTCFDVRIVMRLKSFSVVCLVCACVSIVNCGSNIQNLQENPAWNDAPCLDQNDCAAIYVGNVCEPECPNAAIHIESVREYGQERDDLLKLCLSLPAEDGENSCTTTSACVEGRCDLVATEQ